MLQTQKFKKLGFTFLYSQMDRQLKDIQSEKSYRRQLILQQKQAYEGAKMFYYGVLPLSMIALTMFGGFLYEEGNNQVKDKILSASVWLILTVISYVIAVYFYIKCNTVETYPAPQQLNPSQTIQMETQQKIYSSTQQLTNRTFQASNDDSSNLVTSEVITKPMRNYCHKCNRYAQYRTKHCRKCNTCIERFDHHCFWIGNCVGRHNHKFFYLFLICQSFNNFAQMRAIIQIKQSAYQLDFPLHLFIWILIYTMLLMTIGFLCFTGYLAIYHTMLVILGLTTWEQMRRQKISYLKYLPKGHNPFSQGWVNNIKKFFTQQTRANNSKCKLEKWQRFLPTFQQAKILKPGFNFIENQYYSCC